MPKGRQRVCEEKKEGEVKDLMFGGILNVLALSEKKGRSFLEETLALRAVLAGVLKPGSPWTKRFSE